MKGGPFMYKLFALLICCVITHLSAEVFEDFEYHLPNQAHGWKIAFSLKDCPSEMMKEYFQPECNIIQYVPESFVVDGANEHVEMFMIISNNGTFNLSDTDALISEIKFGIGKVHPNASLTVNILEAAPNSVIFEIVVNNEGQVVMKSLDRYISHAKKLICFSYGTNGIPQYELESPLWLQMLKEIKLVE
jgi:hypothetical protein